ncbi:hypothetical protein ACHAXT_000805 [Thalassiosira profunda]
MIAELCWILAALAAAVLYNYLRWRFHPLNRLPGPIRDYTFREWAVGIFPNLEREPFMQPHKRWWKEAGPDTQLLHYSGLFGKHFICVLDADGVKKILTSKTGVARPHYPKGLFYLRKVIGDGLVTLEGLTWHRHRRMIQPSFNNRVLKEALDACVPDLMDRIVSAWKERAGSDIDVASHFSAITLDIIGSVGFSHEFKSIELIEQWATDENCEVELKDPLITGLYSSLMPSFVRMVLVNLKLPWAERYLIPEARRTQAILNRAVERVVHNCYKNREDPTKEPQCLMELLFDADDSESGSRKKPLTHQELQEETKTFLVAGHETTSTLCVWSLYCLIQHPEIQKLVYQDIQKHWPKDGQITLAALEKMTYFDAFLSEVLRMYPPVGMIVRNTSDRVNLLGEDIPPHTRVMIPIYLLHRHPKYWADPEKFQPERWLDKSEHGRCSHHFAYLPFSAGGRNCIGQRFAVWEAKLILAPIIRAFEMSLSPSLEGVALKLVSFITIKSVPPVLLRATPREGPL